MPSWHKNCARTRAPREPSSEYDHLLAWLKRGIIQRDSGCFAVMWYPGDAQLIALSIQVSQSSVESRNPLSRNLGASLRRNTRYAVPSAILPGVGWKPQREQLSR